ncbi:amidohydrolase [Streptomyces milbemycinicus]|uniref:Amidohydrolase n=1 Tax=Streptomyces milbemycinicus TaxID=476552 RepID=A0ABW8M625_9ACTN
MTGRSANLVVRPGAVHATRAGERPTTALAVRGDRVVAVAGPGEEEALLREWRGADTEVFDDPGLVVLPAFVDTHNHLMLAARNVFGVPVAQAEDIPGFIELIRRRAAQTPPGQWIVTGANWHELQLAERRMPTARELDRATTDHPILAMRGAHNGVLNTEGLHLAGFGPDTPDVPGGFISRDAAGHPSGWLQDAALDLALKVVPPAPPEVLADGLATASAQYAAHGIGTVRDPAVTPDQWEVYRQAEAAGRLAVRSHAMILTTPAALSDAGSVAAYLDALEARNITPKTVQGHLRLWGLKFVLDGGVEAAALCEPYADRPDFHGELLWDRGELIEALAMCVRRGWPVGTHAFGDRAIALLLDAIREVTDKEGPIPPGMLVVEHGGLITPDRIADATALGVHITVQQALLTGLAPALVAAWGQQRTASLFPLRELIDAGAWISAGTDHPIGPLNPLHGIHAMSSRQTPAGVLGPQHAISRAEALRLYTAAGASLLGHPADTTLAPGAPADFVVYPADPLTCPVDRLLDLAPTLTSVGGRVVHHTG